MKIYELLAKPEAWTQGKLARCRNRSPVKPRSSQAVCWCLAGAIRKCYKSMQALRVWERVAAKTKDPVGIWNDHPKRTHADVLALAKELDI